MNDKLHIAIAGAGLIGRRHIEAIDGVEAVMVACIVDPSQDAQGYAKQIDIPWFPSLTEMFTRSEVHGVILATPNQVHVENALECIAHRCPVLVEKPIASNVADAEILVQAAQTAGVPLLTGHHRRHNGLIKKAKRLIEDGTLGSIVSVQGTCWFHKPDDYFDVDWRREPGAGPVFINLIHDIDLLRHLCGDIVSIQALESSAVRGYSVEDTAAVLLRFRNGALGTINISDTVVAPWSWELTASENPAYPETSESCYMIGGTRASLSLPHLTLWQHEGQRSWWSPISGTKIAVDPDDKVDPLIAQIQQFAAVIRGEQPPLVSGEDGLETLRIIEAVKQAALSGETVKLET